MTQVYDAMKHDDQQEKTTASSAQVERELLLMVLAGVFLSAMVLLNVLGITRIVDLSFTAFGHTFEVPIAVGLLPYPLTFLCTDLVSELYGKRHANLLVLAGLGLNVGVVLLFWIGGALPAYGDGGASDLFFGIRALTYSTIVGSMLAYGAAQLVDVQVFHALRRWTGGRMMWLRNNASTLISQAVDSVVVVAVTYHLAASAIPLDENAAVLPQLLHFAFIGYVFKLAAALLDTVPFYLIVSVVKRRRARTRTYAAALDSRRCTQSA